MSERVTMADVAREAGVSVMTVSRVVNDKGEVSPETRERIQRVIEKLNYRPSGIARSLQGGQTYTIGLVVPDISNPYFSRMAHGITKVAYSEGFSVLLCDCEEKPDRELAMLEVLDEKRVDGVVVAAPRSVSEKLLPLLARHPNAVVVNRLFQSTHASTASGYVVNDDKAGGYLVTKHLLASGHVAVGFLAGPETSYGSARRNLGYRKALEEFDLLYKHEIVRHCPPTVHGGKQVAKELVQDHPEIDALFCFNDLVAIGALQCCQQVGRKVPEDMAIIGYDDIPMASWVTPALTTCRVDSEEMGRLAIQLLIDHIAGCDEECENIVLTPTLIARNSAP